MADRPENCRSKDWDNRVKHGQDCPGFEKGPYVPIAAEIGKEKDPWLLTLNTAGIKGEPTLRECKK